ncbi:DUF3786 domain-containing protein [Leadbettera azotonutricia]|uniref:DUF3786 domain-containing protein n=1 Tax=Leadbettera azotonutricia (strain ATCC BAA-888 / DSM 13862 / ZAS-9) TaxID=545695 RepID=F5YA66_LEAAZ|nr:DUF3786 domain-containing protein [Leadbettera azotonutricia]AEF80362.1 hypothetical protein TREAZ_0767 [Leadbettera azotonutricia ZAS-9]
MVEYPMPNGYELTYEAVRPKLKACDFPDAALRLGLDLISPSRMEADFLGRRYEISKTGVRPLDGFPVNPNSLSVLVYYAASRGNAKPGSDFRLLHNFAGPIFTGSGNQWMTSSLAQRYSSDYPGFCAAAKVLGFLPLEKTKRGEFSWRGPVLPCIPVQIAYFEADEEFPCEIKIYYDKSVSDYLEFEPLAVLTGCIAGALKIY